MEAIPGIDSFNLCWNALFIESKQLNGAFFSEKHCSCKLFDSRDINFDLVENRLAYTYKYGCFNILLLEKCISNFLNEYPGVESVLPLENLKVCSLSNGPGLDVVGLLCALYKSNKHLKSVPSLKAVNLYESWCNLYKLVVHSACHVISLKSDSKYFNVPSDNISLIQGDVFSTFSDETKNYISEANVLLMVKVLFSTKATSTVFENTLKEIFSLVKPGTLIFFVGSKLNTKRFSSMDHLNQYVKCLFGPQKVTIDNLTFDESITNSIGTKPLEKGYADFMVWQKRDVFDIQEVTEVKKKSRRKKKNQTSQDFENGDSVTDSDITSEISFTSESKYSDVLSDDFKSDSNSSVHVSHNGIKSEKELNLLQDRIASFLDKINDEDLNYREKTVHAQQNMTGSKSYLKNATNEVKYETAVSADKSITENLDRVNLANGRETAFNVKPQLQSVSEKYAQNINVATSLIADINSGISTNLNHFKNARNDNISKILLDLGPQVKADISEKMENTEGIKFGSSILTDKMNSKISSYVSTLEGIKSRETSKTLSNLNSPMKKGNISEFNVNCANISIDSVNKIHQINLVNPFTQVMNQKDTGENTCSNKTKNKTISSELKSDNGKIKKQTKGALQKGSMSHSCESLCCRNVSSSTETAPSNDDSDVQAVLQRCGSLLTSLEKLMADIKSDISSSKDANRVKRCCSTGQACGNFRAYNFHTSCVNSANRCCFRQAASVPSCQRIQNSCRPCSCSFPCESSASRFNIKRPTNLSKPYITIPLENEDLLHILTLKK